MLIRGVDASEIVRPLLVDATGRALVVMDAQTGDINVNIAASGINVPVEEQAPININWGAKVAEQSNTNLAAGTNYLDDTAIAANELWEVRGMAFRYTGTVTSVLLYPYIMRSGVRYYVYRISGLVSANIYGYSVGYSLEGGDSFGVQVNAATAGNDLNMWLNYARIK